jgi:predicted benzoate:H+ symporter BenE
MRSFVAHLLDALFLLIVAVFLAFLYHLMGNLPSLLLRYFAVAGVVFLGMLLGSICHWAATDGWLILRIWRGRKNRNGVS